MGFMAGFGDAFAQSFGQARAIAAQEEQDAFRMAYQSYLDNNKKRQEDEKLDKLNARKAKALASTLSGVDQKLAAPKIYDMLTSGLDEKYIIDSLSAPGAQLTTIGPQEKEAVSEQTDDTQKMMQESGQMPAPAQDASKVNPKVGLSDKPDSNRPKQAGLFGSPYQKKFFGNRQERILNRANEKIARGTGRSVEEINSINTPYESGKLMDSSNIVFNPGKPLQKIPDMQDTYVQWKQAEQQGDNLAAERYKNMYKFQQDAFTTQERIKAQEKARAEGTPQIINGQPAKILDPNGKVTVKRIIVDPNDPNTIRDADNPDIIYSREQVGMITKDENDRADDIRKNMKNDFMEYAGKNAQLAGMYSSAGIISDTMRLHPEAATSASRIASDWFRRGKGELENLYGLAIGQMQGAVQEASKTGNTAAFDPGKLGELEKMVNDFDNKIRENSRAGKLIGTSEAAALINLHKNLMAYRAGSLLRQGDKALTGAELDNYRDLLMDIDPKNYNYKVASMLKALEVPLDQESLNKFKNNPDIQDFVKQYGYNPFSSYGKSFKDTIAGNEDLSRTYNFFEGFKPKPGQIATGTNGQPSPNTPESGAPKGQVKDAPIQIPRKAVETLKQKPELREDFKKKYGVDDATVDQLLQGNR